MELQQLSFGSDWQFDCGDLVYPALDLSGFVPRVETFKGHDGVFHTLKSVAFTHFIGVFLDDKLQYKAFCADSVGWRWEEIRESVTHRDRLGRFVVGNAFSALGGDSRAAVLTPERRREIARAGFQGFVDKYFKGDRQSALGYIGRLGAWGSDAYKGTVFQKCEKPSLSGVS